MNTNHTWRKAAPTSLALAAGVCLLTGSANAEKKTPAFSEVPGLTAPAASPAFAAPAPAAPLIVQAQSNPPAATPPAAAPAVAAPPVATPPVAAQPAAAFIDTSTESKTLYSFQASDLDLRTALASFARANNLNIIPDNNITGTVTLDVRDLPLDIMMRALLEASDCTWTRHGNLIRIHNSETRTFNVDYLRLSRRGTGMSSATLGSGAMTGGGGMGGGGGGGGGGMGGGGAGGIGGNTSYGAGGSSINVTANNNIDFWQEIVEELGFMLTPAGKASLAVNKTAGIIQVTDRPSALKRVEDYLNGVDRSVHRQVEIEAKLYTVTLTDQFQFGIDWIHLAEAYGGTLGFGAATLPVANGGGQLLDSALAGINHAPGSRASSVPGLNLSTLVFTNFNTSAAVNALQQQGNVEVISTPRIRTLNNQTAMIKVGEEVPFFNTSSTLLPGTTTGTSTSQQNTIVTSITIGTILYITPQVSDNNYVSLDISPVLTSLKSVVTFGDSGSGSGSGSGATAPDLDTKQASTIVRVHDGITVVLGGLIQTQQAKNDTKVPLLGDIPLLGKLFTGTFRFKQKQELVIFVTPHIIKDGAEPPLPPPPAQPPQFKKAEAALGMNR